MTLLVFIINELEVCARTLQYGSITILVCEPGTRIINQRIMKQISGANINVC